MIVTCEKGLFCHARFRFSAEETAAFNRAGRQSAFPAAAGWNANNKEVPLDARKSYFKMQRVQTQKLQYDEEQEEYP